MKNYYIVILLCTFLSTSAVLISQDDKSIYSVIPTDFNSEVSDFSATYFHTDIVWVSDKGSAIPLSPKFSETGRSFFNLYTNSEIFQIQSLVDKINSKYHEGQISVSKDGNTVFFTRNAYVNKEKRWSYDYKMNLQIFYVKFENGLWSDEIEVPVNNTEYSVGHPALSQDEKYLYFSSNMPGGYGGSDLYRIEYNNGSWGDLENLGQKINTSYDELFPFISDIGDLYFASNDSSGMGGLDIYKAEKSDGSYLRGEIMPAPINTEFDDFAFVKQKDTGKDNGLLSSNRPNGSGIDDVYYWEYLVKPFAIKGTVTNTKGAVVANATLDFVDVNGIKQNVHTNGDGQYRVSAERNGTYHIDIDHQDYFNDYFDIVAKADLLTEFFVYDIVLEDFPSFKIRPVDEQGVPIIDMNVRINCDNEDMFTGLSTEEGIFWEFPHKYRRGDSISILIDFNKTGYLNKKVTFNMVVEDGGDVVIPKEQLVFVKAEEKLEISKIIDLQPIYYDFAKWDIRPDAALELDKVIEFLNNNPNISIELSSHTDCRGSDYSNLQLSDKRAKSAADYIKKGISNPNQIYGKGYGETKPIHSDCAGCTEEQHAENRRTEFTIVKVSE
ncbi:MAG: OmpA family protein [Bacteroidales bacterium]|nr:OmpA family protein [Bacteroidales bacterium]